MCHNSDTITVVNCEVYAEKKMCMKEESLLQSFQFENGSNQKEDVYMKRLYIRD